MYYYHTSTYYSANFDRIGRLKKDLYFKTRQSDDVTASFILFSVSKVSLRNSFPIQSALVTTRWSGSMTSERVVSEARYSFCRQGELPSTSMLH